MKEFFTTRARTTQEIFEGLKGTTEGGCKKRSLCALRFAARLPSAEWNCSFSILNGTAEAVP